MKNLLNEINGMLYTAEKIISELEDTAIKNYPK